MNPFNLSKVLNIPNPKSGHGYVVQQTDKALGLAGSEYFSARSYGSEKAAQKAAIAYATKLNEARRTMLWLVNKNRSSDVLPVGMSWSLPKTDNPKISTYSLVVFLGNHSEGLPVKRFKLIQGLQKALEQAFNEYRNRLDSELQFIVRFPVIEDVKAELLELLKPSLRKLQKSKKEQLLSLINDNKQVTALPTGVYSTICFAQNPTGSISHSLAIICSFRNGNIRERISINRHGLKNALIKALATHKKQTRNSTSLDTKAILNWLKGDLLDRYTKACQKRGLKCERRITSMLK